MIADTGSIRGAADILNISPSALNRHIQSLERDLDIKIFDRLSHGVRLSAQGEIFYSFALNQIADFEGVKNQINSIKGLSVGGLKVGLSQDIHFETLNHLIGRFQRDYHNIDLEIVPITQASLFSQLQKGQIDLALCINPILRKGISVLHARNIELCAFIPLGIGLAISGPLRLYELQNIRVALPPSASEVTIKVISAAEKHDIGLLPNYTGPNPLDHLPYCFLPVVGITALAEFDANKFQLSGYKRTHLSQADIGTCNMSLLACEERGISPLAYKFQEVASELFQ